MKPKLTFYILCGTLAILIAGGTAGYVYGLRELTEQKERVQKKQLELADSQKRTSQLIELSRKYDDAKSRLDDIDRALPRQSKQAEILLELEGAGAQTGVAISSLTFTGAATPKNPNTNQAAAKQDLYILPISLRLRGTYPQLIAFLSRLNTISRFNSVTSLATNKIVNSPDQLDISMNLVAYLKP